MIKLVQRRLIIPRGDTGNFTIPVLTSASDKNTVAIFSIFDLTDGKVLYQKEGTITDNIVKVEFTHEETKVLPLGKYVWDIKIYINPEYKNGILINGDEVHSYYAGFQYPICEITVTRDRR